MIDKIKEELTMSNSLRIIIMVPSRNLIYFGKAHLNMLCITFVFFCLMSTTQSLRHWEIKRENGLIETCCFCRIQDLRNGEHMIKECQTKFGNLEIEGYVGPPICSCLSSQNYPKCRHDPTVCGKYIKCPNIRVYDSCIIRELLTEKTMTCNDSLQWEHHIDCNKTCMPSHDIENGIAKCHLLGSKTVCNCTCKEGFVTSQAKNLSCIEAKQAICTPEKNKQNALKIALPIGIILLIIIIIIIIMIIIYYKWEKFRQLFCCGNSPNGNVPNGDLPNEVALIRNSPNGNVPNGDLPNGNVPNGIGHIAQESEQIPRHPVANNTPGGNVPNGDLPNGNVPNGNVPNGIGHIAQESEQILRHPVANNTPGGNSCIRNVPNGDLPNGNVPNGIGHIAQESEQILRHPVANNTPGGNVPNGDLPNGNVPNGIGHIAQESEQIPRHPVANNTPGDEPCNDLEADQDTNHTLQDPVTNNIRGAEESEQIPGVQMFCDTLIDEPCNDLEAAPAVYLYDVGYSGFQPNDPESLRQQEEIDLGQEETEMEPLLSQHEMEPLLSQHETRLPLSQEETCKPNYE